MSVPYVIRKGGMYYAHNSCGYVHSVFMAELYDEEWAKRHAETVDDCEAIPVPDLVKDREQVQEYIDRLEAIQESVG